MVYHVAYFLSDWNYEIVNRFLTGVTRFQAEHPDTEVHVFDNPSKYGSLELDESAFAFFRLPDISNYDGIVIQGNQAWPGPFRQDLADHAHALGIPVVSINYLLHYATYIGTDNDAGMRAVVRHMIEDHGVKRPAFLRGLRRSSEARSREDAFLTVCRECGIPRENIRLLDGSWSMDSGRAAAKLLLADRTHLPEALICANDDLAAGALDEFQQAGLRCPEDILITGFDNLDISVANRPAITSVDRDYEASAYSALLSLHRQMASGAFEDIVRVPTRLLKRASCGCGSSSRNMEEFRRGYFGMRQYMRQFYNAQQDMQAEFAEARTLPELMAQFEKYGRVLDARNAFILLNERFFRSAPAGGDLQTFSGRMALAAVIGEDKDRFHADPKSHIYAFCDSTSLVPPEILEHSRFLIFYQLYLRKTCMGYLVMDTVSMAAALNFLQIILMLVETGIESISRQQTLIRLNRKLDALYVRDRLTGLYNRFGLEQSGVPFFQKLREERKPVAFLFADIDDMKSINDDHGHEAGDTALLNAAQQIRHTCRQLGWFSMRYGGDEFLLFGNADVPGRDVEIRRLSAGFDIPLLDHPSDVLHINHSVGSVISPPEEAKTLKECIQMADARMYNVKKSRHTTRGQ